MQHFSYILFNSLRTVLIGCILIQFSIDNISGQSRGVDYLTPKEGLSQGFIFSLFQDSEGFIWVGTKNGLNRYDGYRFKVFTHDPYDPHSLTQDIVYFLNEFKDYIILRTENGVLQILNKYTYKVYRLPLNIEENGVKHSTINNFHVDSIGTIWYTYNSNHNEAIYSCAFPKNFWTSTIQDVNWQDQIKITKHKIGYPNAYISLHPGLNTKILVSNNKIFNCTEGFGKCDELIELDGLVITRVIFDDRNNLWIGYSEKSVNGLAKIVPDNSGLKVKEVIKVPFKDRYVQVVAIREGKLWLEVENTLKSYELGADYNLKPDQAHDEVFDIEQGNSAFLMDKSGLIWIGSRGKGLIKVNTRSKYISKYFEGVSVYGNIYTDAIGNIITNGPTGNIYTFSKGDLPLTELYLQEVNRYYHYKSMPDASGNIWIYGRRRIGSQAEMSKINTRGKISRYSLEGYRNENLVFSIDHSGNPLIAMSSALLQLDTVNLKHILYEYGNLEGNPIETSSMAQVAIYTWFVGTSNGLMSLKLNKGDAQCEFFRNDSSNSNSLRNNDVLSLLPDPLDAQVLWIGTNGGGLNRLDLRNFEFKHFTKQEGFPNDVIYGILTDEDHNLWMSSNSGLIAYSQKTGRIRNYTSEDGTQGYEFNRWAFSKGSNGLLYFGGVNGLTVIDPLIFSARSNAPTVVFNSLLINGKPINWNKENDYSSQEKNYPLRISIPYNQNNLSFGFAVMDFIAPTKNKFRYFLEGAEEEWSHESSENTASYLNLKPGTYIFKVMGSNSDDVWSYNTAEMMIIIRPPWYASLWAYLAYFIFIGLAVAAFYRQQINRKLARAEANRLKALDEFKSRFFANISHEFRTPLTVILGVSDHLESDIQTAESPSFKKSVNQKINLIRRNGESLLRLINQILDLSKLESSSIRLDKIHGDIIPFIRYSAESLHSLARVSGVNIYFETEDEHIKMDYDPDRLMQIMYNLISNAIRFTPHSGKITVRIETIRENKADSLIINVSDTGKGIPEEALESVFDRFYQANNQSDSGSGGTGIGLALTKELVNLMGGKIVAQSPDPGTGIGSRFRVTLPISHNAAEVDKNFIEQLNDDEDLNAETFMSKKVNASKPTLLLIEDNKDVMEYLSLCLSDRYQLEFAFDGEVGINKAIEVIPDLILSDVMMPVKDGFEVCETLKQDIRTSHIPIILLTAKAAAEDRIAGLKRGADAYVSKPFRREELLVRIEQLIILRKALQKRYASANFISDHENDDPDVVLEDAFIIKLRDVLELNFDKDPFSVNELSREMQMSRTQVHRKLSALCDLSTTEYINSFRLDKAKAMLESGNYNVSEAAYASGFGTAKYFSRLFQEKFGLLPVDYLKKS